MFLKILFLHGLKIIFQNIFEATRLTGRLGAGGERKIRETEPNRKYRKRDIKIILYTPSIHMKCK